MLLLQITEQAQSSLHPPRLLRAHQGQDEGVCRPRPHGHRRQEERHRPHRPERKVAAREDEEGDHRLRKGKYVL